MVLGNRKRSCGIAERREGVEGGRAVNLVVSLSLDPQNRRNGEYFFGITHMQDLLVKVILLHCQLQQHLQPQGGLMPANEVTEEKLWAVGQTVWLHPLTTMDLSQLLPTLTGGCSQPGWPTHNHIHLQHTSNAAHTLCQPPCNLTVAKGPLVRGNCEDISHLLQL